MPKTLALASEVATRCETYQFQITMLSHVWENHCGESANARAKGLGKLAILRLAR